MAKQEQTQAAADVKQGVKPVPGTVQYKVEQDDDGCAVLVIRARLDGDRVSNGPAKNILAASAGGKLDSIPGGMRFQLNVTRKPDQQAAASF